MVRCLSERPILPGYPAVLRNPFRPTSGLAAATSLVTWLPFIAELAWRLVRKRRRDGSQSEEAATVNAMTFLI
jgi:hypothetical protein